MVRSGSVDADQMVREEHGDWQYAGDVIGLFHLAGHAEVLELWELERRQREVLQRKAEMASGFDGDMSLDDMESLLKHADGLMDEGKNRRGRNDFEKLRLNVLPRTPNLPLQMRMSLRQLEFRH